jgi:hypothetical protein
MVNNDVKPYPFWWAIAGLTLNGLLGAFALYAIAYDHYFALAGGSMFHILRVGYEVRKKKNG